jgi:hypothetical protein
MRNGCKCKACLEARAKGIEPIVHCDCGGKYRVDVYRLKTEHKKYGCQCSGFPFDNGTHRKGSSSPDKGWFCHHWKGYEDVLETDSEDLCETGGSPKADQSIF